MSREKQIEEMACENCLHYKACLVNSEYVPSPCRAYENKAGYRKQSEGEWIEKIGYYTRCSICETNVDAFICGYEYEVDYNPPFCPHCGAKMKGVKELNNG